MIQDKGSITQTGQSALRLVVLWLLLGLVLLAGLRLRTVHLADWDGHAMLHPDERYLVYTVFHLRVPHSFQDYLTTSCPTPMPAPSRLANQPHEIDEPGINSGCSTLNPRNYNWSRGYVYGSLPMTLTRLAAEQLDKTDPQGITLVGRQLSTVADLLVTLLIYLTGARLFGRRAGLLAAALYAFTVLGIQQSHFFTTDTFAAFFAMVALYWSVRLAQSRGGWPQALLFALGIGLGIGAAMASKINLAALALLPLLAALQWAWRTRSNPEDGWWPVIWRAAPPLLLAGLASFWTFRLANPDAFAGPGLFDIRPDERFLESIGSVKGLVSGEVDYPPSHQWTARTPWLFPWYNMVLWGMGLALGLTAWAGWLTAAWRLVRRRQGEFLLLVVWVALYFFWQGQQFAKTLRYLLPIYGPLVILAGWGLDRLLCFARTRPWQNTRLAPMGRWMSAGLYSLVGLVLAATFLWGWGFSRIYERPHSRVAAGAWVRANITTDKVLTNELWDDALPGTGEYTQLQTYPYDEDTPEKVRKLVETLAQADYITLTSNRIYGSVSRLPMRYPATNHYYEELFRCATDQHCPFGFELVADFSSYPSFFGLPIPDQFSAEEAFSVYDHPRVLIFKKRPDFSTARAYQLLTEGIAWEEIYRLRPVEATEAPTALRLTQEQWEDQRSAGTWAALFSWDLSPPWSTGLQLLLWIALTEALGLAAFGMLFALRLPLPDRGLSIARPLGLLLLAYGWWLATSRALPWQVSSSRLLLLALAVALLAGGGLALRSRRDELRTFLREHRRVVLVSQGIYAGAFLLFLCIRYLNPDLWHPVMGGEKPMELAYLTAVIKTAAFPPYDPWFAGGYINYYYWGFVLVGAPMKLLGIAPAFGFNLALPMLYGWTALGAWGVAYNLLARWRGSERGQTSSMTERQSGRAILAGCAAALFVVLCGNLAQVALYVNGLRMLAEPQLASDTFFKQGLWLVDAPGSALGQIARGIGRLLNGESLPFRPEWPYWNATRVIPGTVNEFPFFSFLYGDLHAHVIALPLTLVALVLIAALLRSASVESRAPGGSLTLLQWIAPVALLALVLGALRATNTWDYPTYLLLSLIAATVATLGPGAALERPWLRLAWMAGVLVLGSTLLFLPWVRSFASAYNKLQLIKAHERMGVRELLAIYGLWLFVLISYGILIGRRFVAPSLRRWLGIGVLAWFILVWAINGTALLALAPLVGLGSWLLYTALAGDLPRQRLAPLGLAMLGLLILTGTEMVTLAGAGRMNTVFKFGYQVWTFWAIASALALPALLGGLRRSIRNRRRPSLLVWRAALGLLVAAALLYPLTATPARVRDRIAAGLPHTLDGGAFMRQGEIFENGARISLAPDLEAIRWIQSNIEGTPIIAEAHLPSYRWGGRIATWTGLPAVLGWEVHERQQRAAVKADSIINSRQEALRRLYTASDPATTANILRTYGIEYIYVGPLERALYGSDGNIAYFDSLAASGTLKLVYEAEGARLYGVVDPSPPHVLHEPANVIPPADSVEQRLMLPRPVDELPVVGEYADATWLNSHQWAAVLLWLLLWEALGLLALPVAALAFGRSRDLGWSWAKLVGLLIWGYLVWLPASLGFWHYNRAGLLLGAIGLALLSFFAVQRLKSHASSEDGSNSGLAWLWGQMRRRRRAILTSEAVFLAVFGLWTLIRALNPDLWHPFFGGEKPFEFGLLNAILRSPSMPPYDPFYSGGIVNYYYYGLFLVSLPVKALGIDPAIGFNLIVPIIGALTASGALAVTLALARRLHWALAGVVALVFLGNLGGALPLGESRGLDGVIQALKGGGDLGKSLGWWFWGPSRLISLPELVTINEFPFWSLLFADLHPHLIALPITLLIIGLAWELASGSRGIHLAGALALTPLAIGALAISNSWDLPAYSLLLVLALLLRGMRSWQNRSRLALLGWPPAEWQRSIALPGWPALGGILVALGLLLYLPFFGHYWAPVKGLGLVSAERTTPVVNFLAVYGLLIVTALLYSALSWRGIASRGRGAVLLVIAALLLLGLIVWPERRLAFLLAAALLLVGWPLLTRTTSRAAQFALLLAALGFAVALGMELIFIRDHLAGGAAERMNTVFKFGYQVWTLLALASAAALPRMIGMLRRLQHPLTALAKGVALGLGLALLLASLLFTVFGPISRIATRFPVETGLTLDGLAFMRQATYRVDAGGQTLVISLADDAEAIAWMKQNLHGTPVVLQSQREFYRTYGVRIAANTGLPTILGRLHADEQRPAASVYKREQDVERIYSTADPLEALQLLGRYRVNYVYIGALERALYAGPGLEKFQRMGGLEVVYDDGLARLYAVAPEVWELARRPLQDQQASLNGAPIQPGTSHNDRLALLEAAYEANPGDAGTAFVLGQEYRAAGQYDQAILVLRQAADAHPQDVPLRHLLGDVLRDAGRYDEAEAVYREAIAIAPTASNISKLGQELLGWGDLERAEEVLNEALRTDPAFPFPHYFLGELYLLRGDSERARQEFEIFLSATKEGDPYHDFALRRMSELR